MTTAELLARQIADTRDWTLRIIADLKGDDWTFQPTPGMGHALWLCGHLACAQDSLIHKRCLGGTGLLDDAYHNCFKIGVPVPSAAEQDYPSVEVVRARMDEIHAATLSAVRGMSDALLSEPCFGADGRSRHPHYTDKAGAVSHCSRHEAFHAGQIASIRRLRGKPFIR